LYDTKSGINISEFAMSKRTNALCWNPMNPYVFSIANDDMNSYTFDMRKLGKGPTIMHSGHMNAVMTLDYSPTGLEFVTGSYDKTIRIFKTDSTDYNAREVILDT
jgi:WD repeat and SOF domain-containing protein 1